MYKLVLSLVVLVLCLAGSALAQGTSTNATSAASATTAASTPSKRGPVFRPTKDQIMQVQKLLIEKKLYTGTADGKYNDATRTGIKSYQKDNGLKETGTLNRATLEKFGVELTDAQKAIPASPGSYATPEDKSKKTTKSETKSDVKIEKTSATTNNAPKRTIFRATSDQVKAAQKLLRSQSMYSGTENGNLDDATREGLKKYQDANGLKVTGTLNQATLEKMGIELTEKQKAASTTTDDKQK